jgi:alkyl hydroperoxide reductase subunit AhpF
VPYKKIMKIIVAAGEGAEASMSAHEYLSVLKH